METRREATATRTGAWLAVAGGRGGRFHGGWGGAGKKRADFFQGRPAHRPHRPPTVAFTRAHKALDGWVATRRCCNPHGYEWPPVEGPARTCLRTHGSSRHSTRPSLTGPWAWMIFPSVMTEETARNNEWRARVVSTMREVVRKERQLVHQWPLPTPLSMIIATPTNGILLVNCSMERAIEVDVRFCTDWRVSRSLTLVNALMRKLDQRSFSDRWAQGLKGVFDLTVLSACCNGR